MPDSLRSRCSPSHRPTSHDDRHLGDDMTVANTPVQISQPDVGHPRVAVTTHGRAATTVAALAVTFGTAGVSLVVALRQMHGMDMGVATRLGSLGSFVAV